MSDAPSPSDAVEMTEETAEGAADAASEHAAAEGASESVGAEDMGGSSTSIKDALLHTEPRIRPSDAKDELEVGDAAAHTYIGIRKFVAGLGVGDGEGESGTPAIVHFATAGWHTFVAGGSSEESGDDDDRADEGSDDPTQELEVGQPVDGGPA